MILGIPATHDVLRHWPFRARDLELIELYGGIDQLQVQLEVDQPTMAYLADGKPLLMAGLAPLGNGEAEVWTFPTELLGVYLRPMVRLGQRHLRVAMELYDFTVLHALIETEWEEAKRFARLFGFLPTPEILEPEMGGLFERWQRKET